MAVAHSTELKTDGLKDMTNDDLREISNLFASEFNNSDLHDRVLCFEFIEDDKHEAKSIDNDGENETKSVCNDLVFTAENKEQTDEKEHQLTLDTKDVQNEKEAEENSVDIEDATSALLGDVQDLQDEHKQELGADERKVSAEEDKNKAGNEMEDNSELTMRKLFVHSLWLAVQSPYFKALFYSGMKETFSKEVVMKIYEHELPAHLTLIEAMYKLDVLNGKDYRLVSKVLVLAHKYDVRHVIKKCKYVLLSTTPSLEMCKFVLDETSHLDDMTEIYDMLEKFLVEEFTPIDKTWTMDKFAELSEAALKLLLGSDSLATRSENTIFVALMKWVELNIAEQARKKCDLLTVVRFEFMSADFLYDVVKNNLVARQMPEFNEYLLKGLAYHGFSQIRRDHLDPKKRPALPKDDDPTFSWVIERNSRKSFRIL